MQNYPHISWIDHLRVFATFSVILLHTGFDILFQYGTIPDSAWWAANIYFGPARFCVPAFLMISGALLLPKVNESLEDFLKKRLSRVLLPFLFWSLLYIFWDTLAKIYHGERLTAGQIMQFAFFQLKNGACGHLWYIYMLIGIYLFFPIVRIWINHCNENTIKYFLLIWSITLIIQFPFIEKFFPDITLQYFAGYIGFPVLGYYLMKKEVRLKLSVILLLSGILITVVGTYLISRHEGAFSHMLYDYLTPNVALTSAGFFLLFKSTTFGPGKYASLISFFSKYSYGIFLIHIFVLRMLAWCEITGHFIHPLIGIPLTATICFLASSIIIFGVNKVPYGKYISGN